VRGMGFVKVWASEEKKKKGKKYRVAKIFFPCLCICRGRRRTMPFKTALL